MSSTGRVATRRNYRSMHQRIRSLIRCCCFHSATAAGSSRACRRQRCPALSAGSRNRSTQTHSELAPTTLPDSAVTRTSLRLSCLCPRPSSLDRLTVHLAEMHSESFLPGKLTCRGRAGKRVAMPEDESICLTSLRTTETCETKYG